MNRYGYQQNGTVRGSGERQRMMVDCMICPKPRRLGLLNPLISDQLRPLRLSVNCTQTAKIRAEMGESLKGAELLEIILRKGRYGGDTSGYQVASSPPFYFGSPPRRASNPVIQDTQFGNGGISPLCPIPPSPSARMRGGGGCVGVKCGHKPTAVRIVGFDCLSRDRRNCSISAVA